MRVTITQNIKNYKITVKEPKKAIKVLISQTIKPFNVTVKQLGKRGFTGKSNYEIAVDNGFLGTEEQWLLSLRADGLIYINGEVPTGLINGINATFYTLNDFVAESVEVYLNGIRQKIVDDYQTIGLRTIQLNVSPSNNENIIINYLKL